MEIDIFGKLSSTHIVKIHGLDY